MALTGNWTDAEEVIQEAVVRTVRAKPRLLTEQDAHNYILTAVRTSALKLFEQRRRLRLLADEVRDRAQTTCPGPLAAVIDEEDRSAEAALAGRAILGVEELEPLLRQVVELLLLREPPLKLRDVAEIQNAAISTVHSRLRAALRDLGQKLEPPEE